MTKICSEMGVFDVLIGFVYTIGDLAHTQYRFKQNDTLTTHVIVQRMQGVLESDFKRVCQLVPKHDSMTTQCTVDDVSSRLYSYKIEDGIWSGSFHIKINCALYRKIDNEIRPFTEYEVRFTLKLDIEMGDGRILKSKCKHIHVEPTCDCVPECLQLKEYLDDEQ